MADERTCYAGDLTTDQIGKTIKFSPAPGVVIEDKLRALVYGNFARIQDGDTGPNIYIETENLSPHGNDHSFSGPFGAGWIIGHTVQVTVYR